MGILHLEFFMGEPTSGIPHGGTLMEDTPWEDPSWRTSPWGILMGEGGTPMWNPHRRPPMRGPPSWDLPIHDL